MRTLGFVCFVSALLAGAVVLAQMPMPGPGPRRPIDAGRPPGPRPIDTGRPSGPFMPLWPR